MSEIQNAGAINRAFDGQTLDLTEGRWLLCTFHDCTLIRRPGGGIVSDCVMLECKLEGDGWDFGLPPKTSTNGA